MTELKTLKDLTSWTCECNCVTFDNEKCRACGKDPKYGEVDYEELKAEAVKWIKEWKSFESLYYESCILSFKHFFNLTEEDLEKKQ